MKCACAIVWERISVMGLMTMKLCAAEYWGVFLIFCYVKNNKTNIYQAQKGMKAWKILIAAFHQLLFLAGVPATLPYDTATDVWTPCWHHNETDPWGIWSSFCVACCKWEHCHRRRKLSILYFMGVVREIQMFNMLIFVFGMSSPTMKMSKNVFFHYWFYSAVSCVFTCDLSKKNNCAETWRFGCSLFKSAPYTHIPLPGIYTITPCLFSSAEKNPSKQTHYLPKTNYFAFLEYF